MLVVVTVMGEREGKKTGIVRVGGDCHVKSEQ